MKEYPTYQNIQDTESRETLRHIFNEGQGKVITLTAAPTATAPQIEPDEWGVYSNVLYHRVANTILVFTPGSTISVT